MTLNLQAPNAMHPRTAYAIPQKWPTQHPDRLWLGLDMAKAAA